MLGWFGLRRCANLDADGCTGSMSVLKIHRRPPCWKPLAKLWVGRGSAVRPVLSVSVYSWTGLAWSLRDLSRSCLISLRFGLISLRSSLILLRSLRDPEISTDLTKLVDFSKDQLIYAKSSDVSNRPRPDRKPKTSTTWIAFIYRSTTSLGMGDPKWLGWFRVGDKPDLYWPVDSPKPN